MISEALYLEACGVGAWRKDGRNEEKARGDYVLNVDITGSPTAESAFTAVNQRQPRLLSLSPLSCV
jgi:hypothetical protein